MHPYFHNKSTLSPFGFIFWDSALISNACSFLNGLYAFLPVVHSYSFSFAGNVFLSTLFFQSYSVLTALICTNPFKIEINLDVTYSWKFLTSRLRLVSLLYDLITPCMHSCNSPLAHWIIIASLFCSSPWNWKLLEGWDCILTQVPVSPLCLA